ncbi:hypothetical protein KAI56_01325 [Candidatus Parcubacteria bacterium]|nr:hypothetical protein [Candidatus Parcubacteria bacterium]
MENRFIKNRDTVKKIADSFGLVLFGFDPSWSFSLLKDAIIKEKPKETMKDVIEHRVPDDFMGKVAVFMGYEWEFAESMNDIEKEIKELKNSLNVLKREREKERKREREKERKRERRSK